MVTQIRNSVCSFWNLLHRERRIHYCGKQGVNASSGVNTTIPNGIGCQGLTIGNSFIKCGPAWPAVLLWKWFMTMRKRPISHMLFPRIRASETWGLSADGDARLPRYPAGFQKRPHPKLEPTWRVAIEHLARRPAWPLPLPGNSPEIHKVSLSHRWGHRGSEIAGYPMLHRGSLLKAANTES